MQPASSTPIPDGLLAAMTPLSENPCLGFERKNPALHPGHNLPNSTAAIGDSWSVASETRWSHQMGRFISPDWSSRPSAVPYAKLGNPQSLNLYSYVGNNPLSRVDFDGHCWSGFQWACDLGQRIDNAVHGEGFNTDAQVEANVHNANLTLRKNGISTEGLKDSQVLSMAAALGRPSAAQARAIYEKATGQKVPFDEELGRYYDMHHIQALKDGGAPRDPNNLTPIKHDEHMALHSNNGDYSRWASSDNEPYDPILDADPIGSALRDANPLDPAYYGDPDLPAPGGAEDPIEDPIVEGPE